MLVLRTAEIDDAAAIAKVHVDTWRAAYSGIIPQSYLNSMTIQNRSIGWMRLLERSGPGAVTLVSEHDNGHVVGFVAGGPVRHHEPRFQAEISSLYVQPRHQHGRHGRRLFLAASDRLARFGYKGLFVWVLAENPARAFYEELGGRVVSEATRTFAGKLLTEIGYGWDEIPQYG